MIRTTEITDMDYSILVRNESRKADFMIKDKKNIMYISNDLGYGGAVQSLLDTLAEIKGRVRAVVIVRDNSASGNEYEKLGIKVYKLHFSVDCVDIGSADAGKKVQDFKQSYEAAKQLLPIIKNEKIDVIHINSSTSYFAAIAAIQARIPYVWHVRELMQEHFNREFLNEELKICLYKKADKMIAISDYVQEQYGKKYGLKMYRLYDGFRIARFKEDIASKDTFEKNFMAASMITPMKRQWDVIRAAELLVRKGHDGIKVNIVGKGVEDYVWVLHKYIKKKKLENNIHIIPFQDDLRLLRTQAAYAITSSQNEALGRVTVEAMLAGNIVIGARSGGTTEIIGGNEERGFLYELGNVESLASTMERAMNCDIEKKKSLLREAQKYAEDIFDAQKYCDKLLEIYEEVMASYEPRDENELLSKLEAYYDSIMDREDDSKNSRDVPGKKSGLMLSAVLKWLEIRQSGHDLGEYFKNNHIQSIAIYGMGVLGCRLYDELEDSDIQIKYLMDRNPKGMDAILEFSSLEEKKTDVDAVVVTVLSSQENIINEIGGYGYRKVIGLSEVLNSFNQIIEGREQ